MISLASLMEESLQIAWGLSRATGEIEDNWLASRYLGDAIELMIRQVSGSRLVLSNRAITAYLKFKECQRCGREAGTSPAIASFCCVGIFADRGRALSEAKRPAACSARFETLLPDLAKGGWQVFPHARPPCWKREQMSRASVNSRASATQRPRKCAPNSISRAPLRFV